MKSMISDYGDRTRGESGPVSGICSLSPWWRMARCRHDQCSIRRKVHSGTKARLVLVWVEEFVRNVILREKLQRRTLDGDCMLRAGEGTLSLRALEQWR